MFHARWLAALLAALALAGESQAQFIIGPGGGLGFGYGGSFGLGLSYNRIRGGRGFSAYLNYNSGFGYGYCGYPVFGSSYTSLSIITPPQPPPVIIINNNGPPPGGLIGPPRFPPPPPPEEEVFVEVKRPMRPIDPPLGGGDPAGKFKPVDPADRDKAKRPVPPDDPKAPPPPPPRPKAGDKRPELPAPPLPDPDPKVEQARLLRLGKDAFAVQERGRAAHWFRQAMAVNPGEPMPHLLLALTQFSLGKYNDAVRQIEEGMRRDPEWQNSKFRPLDYYGANPADYPEHLRNLEDALKRDPDNPNLLFLMAYQLWFDGRTDEAIPLFEKAARLAPDRTFIDRFLKAKPPKLPIV